MPSVENANGRRLAAPRWSWSSCCSASSSEAPRARISQRHKHHSSRARIRSDTVDTRLATAAPCGPVPLPKPGVTARSRSRTPHACRPDPLVPARRRNHLSSGPCGAFTERDRAARPPSPAVGAVGARVQRLPRRDRPDQAPPLAPIVSHRSVNEDTRRAVREATRQHGQGPPGRHNVATRTPSRSCGCELEACDEKGANRTGRDLGRLVDVVLTGTRASKVMPGRHGRSGSDHEASRSHAARPWITRLDRWPAIPRWAPVGRDAAPRACLSGSGTLRILEICGGGVEVVVAALHPGVAPEEVAAGLGPQDPPVGFLEQPVQAGVVGADADGVTAGA